MVKKQKETTTFKNNPFRSVKGFCVSEPEEKPHNEVKKPVQTVFEEDSEIDFATAMEKLGVEGMESSGIVAERTLDEEGVDDEEVTAPVEELDDESLFLASMGEIDRVFADEFPEENDDTARAEPRRMKKLRQGKLRPQDTLDLHGCYRDEARDKVRLFLKHRFEQGLQTVLIITGRGKRSPGGESVLRQDVERYLSTQAQAWVAEWGRAPRQYGGEGALVIFLRQKK